MPGLNRIDLSCNKIKTLQRKSFDNLRADFAFINLQNNLISYVHPQVFEDMLSEQVSIYLDHNLIENVDNIFDNHSFLEIWLNNNPIKHFSDVCKQECNTWSIILTCTKLNETETESAVKWAFRKNLTLFVDDCEPNSDTCNRAYSME